MSRLLHCFKNEVFWPPCQRVSLVIENIRRYTLISHNIYSYWWFLCLVDRGQYEKNILLAMIIDKGDAECSCWPLFMLLGVYSTLLNLVQTCCFQNHLYCHCVTAITTLVIVFIGQVQNICVCTSALTGILSLAQCDSPFVYRVYP